ncbi:hypothetical protein LNKW23_48900 [Paralimibaculum aggregatum]|uniref:Uncharacterized protein n=1 Tax=Paralimibaculum aggregatum TaxID=3036245 RepID=A0ABQ6LUB7_9RHOB|nr:hypothetical protein LNKW23_48900 [Limibaculum sp. NKW23]
MATGAERKAAAPAAPVPPRAGHPAAAITLTLGLGRADLPDAHDGHVGRADQPRPGGPTVTVAAAVTAGHGNLARPMPQTQPWARPPIIPRSSIPT